MPVVDEVIWRAAGGRREEVVAGATWGLTVVGDVWVLLACLFSIELRRFHAGGGLDGSGEIVRDKESSEKPGGVVAFWLGVSPLLVCDVCEGRRPDVGDRP